MMRRGFGRRGPGLLGVATRTAVIAGTATAVSGTVARKQQAKAVQRSEAAAYEQQQQYVQQQMAEPVESAGPSDEDIERLQKLGQLHAQGILTDEEFAAQKAQILGL